ncbi:MAG TPA: hypothetical protein VNT26_02750 [Candidatus Sulfotelmatobacter sp.]|nr:hypothetical protein [Candidatus Sulfotelmatobacter sp.]
MACQVTSQLIRLIERMRKREPHFFDYAAIEREEAWKAEVRRALDRVYGAAPIKTEPPAK